MQAVYSRLLIASSRRATGRVSDERACSSENFPILPKRTAPTTSAREHVVTSLSGRLHRLPRQSQRTRHWLQLQHRKSSGLCRHIVDIDLSVSWGGATTLMTDII